MADNDPAVVTGSTTTVKTMVDGTLRVALDIEPAHAQLAFRLFGSPGTPVVLARLTPEAAMKEARAATQAKGNPLVREEDHGPAYAILYRYGWWHNPKVLTAFEVPDGLSPPERVNHIKQRVYVEVQIETLKDLEPHFFGQLCATLGVYDTLPPDFRDLC